MTLLRPFLTLPASAMRCSQWRQADGRVLEGAISWHPGTDIEAERLVTFDTEKAAEVLRTVPEDLLVSVEFACPKVGTRGNLATAPLGVGEVSLNVAVPGGLLGGQLTLRTVVHTSTTPDPKQPGDPTEVGSILWDDHITVLLEGGGAQLSVLPVSFDARGYAEGAPWRIVVKGLGDGSLEDLNLPASEILTVLINTDMAESAALGDLGESTDEQAVLRRVLKWEIGRKLVQLASETTAFRPADNFKSGSIGALLKTVTSMYVIDDRSQFTLLQRAPHLLDQRIQSTHRLGR